MCDSADKERGEYIRFAYKSTLEDIRFFKTQQWLIIYYTLLTYGAIVAVANQCNKLSKLSVKPLEFIPVVVGILSILIIVRLEYSINDQRKLKKKAIEAIPKNEQDFFEEKEEKSHWLITHLVVSILSIVIFIGALVTFWVF